MYCVRYEYCEAYQYTRTINRTLAPDMGHRHHNICYAAHLTCAALPYAALPDVQCTSLQLPQSAPAVPCVMLIRTTGPGQSVWSMRWHKGACYCDLKVFFLFLLVFFVGCGNCCCGWGWFWLVVL